MRVDSKRPAFSRAAIITTVFFAANFLISAWPRLGAGATTAAPGGKEIQVFNPPWNFQNPPYYPPILKPKEVKDRDNEKPVSWCTTERSDPSKDDKQRQITADWHETTVTYSDGTQIRFTYEEYVQYWESRDPAKPGTLTSKTRIPLQWVIELPGPGGKTRITYKPDETAKTYLPPERSRPTRTIEEPGKEPRTEPWEDQIQERKQRLENENRAPVNPQEAPKKGSWLQPFSSQQLVNIIHRQRLLSSATIQESPLGFAYPLLLAADTMQSRPSTQPRETREEPRDNIKAVFFGGPPSEPVTVVFEQPPQTTPEEFVGSPPMSNWNPKTDSPGPTTASSGPDGGIPVSYVPGGFVNLGSGWSSQRVPSSFLRFCSGGAEDAHDRTVSSGMTIERLPAVANGDEGKQATLPDGTTVKVFPKYGSIELPNGTAVRRWSKGTRAITLPNGTGMLIDPSEGTAGLHLPDETSIFASASGTHIDLPDGRSLLKRPDGTIVQNLPNGTQAPYTGQTTVKVPNGATVDMSDKNGTIVTTPDGTRAEIATTGGFTRVQLGDLTELFAFRDGEVLLGMKGGPQIHMEKDGKTDISAISGGPKISIKTDGVMEGIKGGAIY